MKWDLGDKSKSSEQIEVKKEDNKTEATTTNRILYSDEKIRSMLYKELTKEDFHFCCLFYGNDGTGKTGLIQSYPLKDNEKHIILDLDGGNRPILHTYWPGKLKNIIIENPLVTKVTEDGLKTIDFHQTMNKIKWVVDYVRRNHKEDNIKAISIDGLSKLLKYAENQMRIEKHIKIDGGVDYRYWKRRNELFLEILEIMKTLPIDKFFIAHENFILLDEYTVDDETPSVVREANRMMYQKVRCKRKKQGANVTYTYIIDKSKYNVHAEGKEEQFLIIDTDKKSYRWKGHLLYELLTVNK